ncbi:MAG: DUF4214 domain-containing protein, partial [Flavobacteriaceae bacterium]|nr:DUF4214 domain-containing protein [Flavobacteriaceae bacterium]
MSTASDLERYMLELVNAERAAYGLPPVTLELTMNSATEDHSQWMSDANTFSHTGAGGSTPTARMLAAGLDLSGSWTTAENIAAVTVSGSGSYYDEVAQLHQNLMDSPGHRANILNPDVTWIGIGIVVGPLSFSGGSPRDAVLVTQNFAYASAGVPRLDLAGGEVADVLVGGAGADHIDGRGGNDVLRTGAGDDTVLGGAGNDRIEVMLGQGDKTIDGGTGTDTVVLSLDQSDVSGSWQGSTLVLDTGYGTLRLDNVETLQFADGAVSAADFGDGRYTRIQGTTAAEGLTGSAEDDLILGAGGADTLTGLAGDDILLADPGAMARLDQGAEVYRLFDTVFGREPGRSGLEGFATGLLTGQSSLESLAESFMASAEFTLRYGDTTDAEFITLLFNNVFGRDPSATGLAAWTARLATESRAEIILAFSETAEHVNLTR